METQNVLVISIHPDATQPHAVDLRDFLMALKPFSRRWIWCVRNLDWLGEGSDVLCQRIEASAPAGTWITTEELLHHASKIYQTIEGDFLAFPREVDLATVTRDELALGAFPASRAELAIVAVDSSYFDIYAKEAEFLVPLRQFRDVRDEDPNMYF